MALFCVNALSKRIGSVSILSDVSFELDPGQSMGIMGKNGAGKTTLLKLLSLTSRPSRGSIYWNDSEVSARPDEFRRLIGALFHQVHLYGDLTASQNLQFYAGMFSLGDVSSEIDSWLDKLALYRRRNDLVRTYSRGMQQRLSIARALLHKPKVLLLDEPVTGLDENGCRLFDNILTDFRSRGGITIMVAHAWDQIRAHADQLTVLEKGKVLTQQGGKHVRPAELHEILSR